MPTYEYRCDACEHEFEMFQSITAGAIRKCPECGKLKVKRLISSGAGFIFKGSGFYETDYRSDQYKKDAKADTEAAKTDSKPKDDKSKKAATKDTGDTTTKKKTKKD